MVPPPMMPSPGDFETDAEYIKAFVETMATREGKAVEEMQSALLAAYWMAEKRVRNLRKPDTQILRKVGTEKGWDTNSFCKNLFYDLV